MKVSILRGEKDYDNLMAIDIKSMTSVANYLRIKSIDKDIQSPG